MTESDLDVLKYALVGYQAELEKIDGRLAEIRAELGGRRALSSAVVPAAGAASARRSRGMSAAAKARIAAAQRKRWAAFHKEQGATAPTQKASRGGKRKMSAAGREAIAKATRKRWAAYRAQKAKAKART